MVSVDVRELDVDQQENLEGGLGVRSAAGRVGHPPPAPAGMGQSCQGAPRGSAGVGGGDTGATTRGSFGIRSGERPELSSPRRELTWSLVLPSRSLMWVVTILSVSSRNLG